MSPIQEFVVPWLASVLNLIGATYEWIMDGEKHYPVDADPNFNYLEYLEIEAAAYEI